MFLKWKTSDFGKHAIICGERSNIQRENLLPCWRAGVKSAEKNTFRILEPALYSLTFFPASATFFYWQMTHLHERHKAVAALFHVSQ